MAEVDFRTVNRSEMARALGVSPSCMSRIIAGNRTPSLDLAKKMADYFKVSLDDLLAALRPPE